MRLLTVCCAAVVLFAAPSKAEEARDTAALLTDCVTQFKIENGFTPNDDLTGLRDDHSYRVYGRDYFLRTGGTATDICKSAVFDRLGMELDQSISEVRRLGSTLRLETERAGEIQRKLDQYAGVPFGVQLPLVTPALIWIRENPYWAPMVLVPMVVFLFLHFFSLTPWYYDWRIHAEAKKRARRERKRIRSARKTVRPYRKPLPRWVGRLFIGLGIVLFFMVGIAFS